MTKRLIRMAVLLKNAARYGVSVRDDAGEDPPTSPTAVTGWGLVVGLIFCLVFAGSWKHFGDIYFSEYSRLRLVPSVMVILAGSILGFKQLLAVAVTVDQMVLKSSDPPPDHREALRTITLAGLLAVFLVILLKFSALLAMPYHTPWWPGSDDWRHVFNRFYPRMLFRVLILLALWGKTALIIAGTTGSTHPSALPADRAFRRAGNIKTLLFNLAIVMGLTTIYFSSWRNRAIGVLISLFLFLLLYLASMALARYRGGHDRYSMFACAELGEVALLLGYLAAAKFL